MSGMSHRRAARSGNTAAATANQADASSTTASVSNAQQADELKQTESASGPFASPMLNAALEQAFGQSLGGLSATNDPARNEALGARAMTEGSAMSFGKDATEDMGDLDFLETAAHETAHALAGGGSGKTALDTEGDQGEAKADAAGQSFRAWAQTGFAGPAPSLTPATGGQAAIHRHHTVGSWRGRPVLRVGVSGVQVRSLQTLLNAHGARLRVDGVFGNVTRRALMAFQRARGLMADGIAGPQTGDALNASSTTPVPDIDAGSSGQATVATVTGSPELSMNSRGGIVSALQELLNSKGASLTVDGVFGHGTHRAVVAFQRANGMGVDGVVGPNTARRLNDNASTHIPSREAAGSGGDFAGNEAFDSMRDAVIAAAESHLGVPYYWGGNGPGTFDCSGFVLYVLRQNTGLIDWGDDTAAGIRNRVPAVNTPQRGDLVFYRGRNGITHIEFAMGVGSQTIGASGGGSRTFGDDPGAKVQYSDWSRDGRSKSFGSLDRLIQNARR